MRPGVSGAMKNLIFASTGEKPELIFRDAVNNDVEIVKNADKVLIYDRPLPPVRSYFFGRTFSRGGKDARASMEESAAKWIGFTSGFFSLFEQPDHRAKSLSFADTTNGSDDYLRKETSPS